ncbi:sodium:alanine symporter family protein [Salmonella enterica]|nr:sodium:alanine symporter family protein [Salmonella enterica]
MLTAISEFFELLWGGPLFIFVVGVGLYFSCSLKFFQLTRLRFIFSNTLGTLFGKNKQDTSGEVTGKHSLKSVEVAATVLSGTLGAGSIAGVATAIAIGGPGAVFWMWIIALLGMMTKMVEVTLALRFRTRGSNGEYYGGPMYYIKNGLGPKWAPLAGLYAVALLTLVTTDACFVQTNTMASVLEQVFSFPVMWTGIGIVLAGILVIFKGVKALGAFCTYALPPIALCYLIGAGWVIVGNISAVPSVFIDIIHYAFAPTPAVGGFVGSTIIMAMSKGVSRGIFTNEAGMGTSATVHSTANVDYPFRQGMWGAVEVFIVSMITCNFTAFAVLSSGMWSSADFEGIGIAFAALSTVWHPVAVKFLSLGTSLILFTSYLGSFLKFRTSINYIFGEKGEKYLKWFFFIPPVIAVNLEIPVIWLMADAAVGFLVIPNIIALILLRKEFKSEYQRFTERNSQEKLQQI